MKRTTDRKTDTTTNHATGIISAAFLTLLVLAAILLGLTAAGDYFHVRSTAMGGQSRDARKDGFVFAATIGHRTRNAQIAAGSEQVLDFSRLPSEAAARLTTDTIKRPVEFLHDLGFTSIAIVRPDGIVIRSGAPLPSSIVSVPLKSSLPARLLWNNGFYLETRHELKSSKDEFLGTMVAQQPIPTLDEIFRQDPENGKTHDMMLCGPISSGAMCFASRSKNGPFTLTDTSDQRLQLIQSAFAGETSTEYWTRTSVGRVLASSVPVGSTGLALTKTVAVWETLIPLDLEVGAIALVVFVLMGLSWPLLTRAVKPLVDTLILEKERSNQNEHRFIAAMESSLSAFYLLDSVRDERNEIIDFRFVYLNGHAEKLIHRRSADLLGKWLCTEIPMNRTAGFFDKYRKVVETGIPFNEEASVSSVDVDAAWVHLQVVRLGDGIAITTTDISLRKRMEIQLEKALGFTQAIIDASPFSTIVTDLEGNIVAVNPATERMLWYTKAEMVGKMTPLSLHDPVELKLRAAELSAGMGVPVAANMEVFIVGPKRGMAEENEWTYIRKDGSRLPVQLTVTALTDDYGHETGYMGIAYDITERKRQQDYISHLAHHDSLTGLPTRILFKDRVDVALARVQRYGGKCALMLIDLDNFKDINDSLGHHAGDEVLIVIAQRLKEVLRSTDTVSRMGGDEFTVLLDHITSEEDATTAAVKLLATLSKPILIGEDLLPISASIGISIYPEGGATSGNLLKNADAAMYYAKGSGKQSYRLFTQGLADATTKRLQMEMALKKAIKSQEFSVVYQPQVALANDVIIGVEVLARWKSERLGVVPPSDFIPIAEQCGVIAPLGEWILRTACNDVKALSDSIGRPLRLAVNVSPRQLEREGFAARVALILVETMFPAEMLEIEITEGVLMSDSLLVWEALKDLQSQGVQMAIDDFGTGFSNISYLLKLSVNQIKIDRSFITNLEDDPGCDAVVGSLISMANTLGVTVVAEGVETEGQRDILRAKGCHEAQGYFYHRPMDVADLMKVLQGSKVGA
ncbi:sensor domain-containing protein [Terriglobus saanensis]|uniref:Diguanylate cyclase/phosphodiesterase with PAS/PAC sensor(S) n=1 Tax=Terriglobus saanensis (strain ATCC BAA-1853 / DSM 23119 / SP1PR4) TaxID=401053 RepID=E8UZX2_TERSS|nr:EAL domain-containing protein [Terriglobus saanensis]ADV81049.1 diguanylate cyclase/phosphodiesterase with PAS/PAC sensor(s) [Terriglobus saanensis SP1PR4]